ncbi:MAG TPA: dienelactone hydrolase family protein [Acidimicrobiales bacterium]|nr:dienelactone hydrolase family protein [Acidimicrobiales bacterium]
MCFGDHSRPPLPPVRGGATDHGDLVLRSADGTEFAAYYAHPDAPSNAGMIVMPDVRGLHEFYKELARRFAEAGIHSVAFDYFGRTAGMGPRTDDFPYREHVDKLELQTVSEDVAAARDWLRSLANGSVDSVFSVGFCMGGALSWAQSAAGLDLSGCVGFYGRPERVSDRIGAMKAPLLLLAAGQDFTPVADVEKFAEQVRANGVETELHVYPDAPHSFFDRTFAEHAEACDDAWRRILDFVERHRRH